MKNMKYARLVDGVFTNAPKPLVVDGIKIYTNVATAYHDAGWYTVELHDMPDTEGYTYEETWVENDDTKTIVQNWTGTAVPGEDAGDHLSFEDRLADIELAICELYDALI